jgi:peroxiredoxin (alkyl hydroperoxide reductase subunit C)
VIKTMEVHSNEIARDVSETLRKLCPVHRRQPRPGLPRQVEGRRQTLTPSLDLVGKI